MKLGRLERTLQVLRRRCTAKLLGLHAQARACETQRAVLLKRALEARVRVFAQPRLAALDCWLLSVHVATSAATLTRLAHRQADLLARGRAIVEERRHWARLQRGLARRVAHRTQQHCAQAYLPC